MKIFNTSLCLVMFIKFIMCQIGRYENIFHLSEGDWKQIFNDHQLINRQLACVKGEGSCNRLGRDLRVGLTCYCECRRRGRCTVCSVYPGNPMRILRAADRFFQALKMSDNYRLKKELRKKLCR